jgi:hypothetical protein
LAFTNAKFPRELRTNGGRRRDLERMLTAREKTCRYLQSLTTEGRGGCWLWRGPLDPDGYGVVPRGTAHPFGTQPRAARWALTLVLERPLRRDEIVLHTCRVAQCIRPDHLVLTTASDPRCSAHARYLVSNLDKSWSTPERGPSKSQA